MGSYILTKLYCALIRPILEYGRSIWAFRYKMDIDNLEAVQGIATRMVPDISGLAYQDRLKALCLFSLHHRRRRNDMIEVYKMMHRLVQTDKVIFFKNTKFIYEINIQ